MSSSGLQLDVAVPIGPLPRCRTAPGPGRHPEARGSYQPDLCALPENDENGGPGVDPDGIAELLQSVSLGFVAQRALAGDADMQAHAGALDALTRRCSAAHLAGRGVVLDGTLALKPAAPRTCRA